MNTGKFVLVFFFICFLFFPFLSFAQEGARGLETRYPSIEGLTEPPQTVKSSLPKTVRYVFEMMIGLSAALCFVAVFTAGVKMAISAGDPKARMDARKDIEQVLLGVLIIFGSYLISKTINPEFVNPEVKLEALSGITVYEDTLCQFAEDNEEMDGKDRLISSNANLEGSIGFEPHCIQFENTDDELTLILYNEPDFKDRIFNLPARVGQAGFSEGIGSILFLWHYPGIYLCSGEYEEEEGEWLCNGDEKLYPYSTNLLGQDIKNNLGGLKIEEVIESTIKTFSECDNMGGIIRGQECIHPYGVVLHEKADNSGRCEVIDPTGLSEEEFMYFADDLEGRNPTFSDRQMPSEGQACDPEEEGKIWCSGGSYYLICMETALEGEPLRWVRDMCPPEMECCGESDRCQGLACLEPGATPEEFPLDGKEPAFNLKNTSSITVFSPKEETRIVGGVYFCEEPDPDITREPRCYGPYQKIRGNLGESVTDERTGESLEALPNAKRCAAQWTGIGNGISSIVIKGNFLAVLFDKEDFKGECEVFDKSDSNLTNNPIGGCCESVAGIGRTDCTSSVIVLPTHGEKELRGRVPSTVPSCKDQCEEDYMTCNDTYTGYKICGNYDRDPCLDWPEEYTICTEGSCVLNPDHPCGIGGAICTAGETACVGDLTMYAMCVEEEGETRWVQRACPTDCQCYDGEDTDLRVPCEGEGPCWWAQTLP